MKRHILLTVLFVMIFSISIYAESEIKIQVQGEYVEFNDSLGYPFIDENNRTLVPFRAVLEEFGAIVEWDSENNIGIAKKDGITIKVPIGENYIIKGDEKIINDTAAVIKDSRTYLPIRVVMESFGSDVIWDQATRTVKIQTPQVVKETPLPATIHQTRSFDVNGKSIKAEVVTIDLNNPSVRLKTALAKGLVGRVDSLENIAKENNGSIAINGTFFDAYTEVTEPYGVINIDGKLVHIGTHRSVFGFDRDNNVDIDILMPKIEGSNGEPSWKYSWYGYWLNRTPVEGYESVILYTSERGSEIGTDLGTNVIIEDGKVTNIVDGNVQIPKDGLVINFYGAVKDTLLHRFEVGGDVKYSMDLNPVHGNEEFWSSIKGAIGAGPGLVWNGNISLDLQGELFIEDKILTMSAARSAIGFTEDNKLILLTTRGATINELAHVMQQLGCKKAMNLDGGASSGLYYKGKTITKTGREISNAILVIEE